MDRLGRYELGRPLGRGGTGTVYEAVLVGPGGFRKPVALKVLHRGAPSLRREARLGGLLRHRHLCDVYEVGEQDGRWFCALELCPRGSLAARPALPPRAVVEVGLMVAAALEYAHAELGLVHLDLKPANLLLAADGDVKVADLGIARARGDHDDGRVRGTPGYMAPEQSCGRPVDARSDVFSLGVTLVELATGRRITNRTFDRELWADAADGTDLPGAVPRWLAPAVTRCLEPDPGDRWPDMGALAAALRSLEADGPGLREALGIPADAAVPGPAGLGPEPDSWVGRQVELALLLEALGPPGVLVLKGPPGIGKSRLAAAAARRWRELTGGLACVCDLHAARSVDEVVYALSATLDVPLGGGGAGDHLARLAHALEARGSSLVVLDGVEPSGELAPAVLERLAASGVRLLVTSRAAVAVGRTIDVGPLVPEDARALLAARARERGVEVASDPLLVDLAARLDGVPLALELAAGRLGVLSVGEVLERLSLSMLRRGTGGRHGSLRAALDWSWDLLAGPERIALSQLSVFAGSFSPEAAEDVVACGAPVWATIGALVDRSMVSTAGGGRLRLLAGVAAYASEKLGDPGAASRHGRYFARSGTDEALDALSVHGGAARQRALALDLDDLVLACRRAIARDDAPVAVAAVRAAWAVLGLRGPFETALPLVCAVVALRSAGPIERAAALRVQGAVLGACGRSAAARGAFEEARAIHASAGDRASEAVVLGNLGTLLQAEGRTAEAHEHYRAALAVHRAVGARRYEGVVLGNLAALERERGHMDEARRGFEAALAVHRAVGDRRAEGLALGNLGNVEREVGLHAEAREAYEAALRALREVGDRRFEGLVLGNLGIVLGDLGRMDEARATYEAALRIHRETGARRSAAVVLGNLGDLHRKVGRAADSRACYEAALDQLASVDDRRGEGNLRLQLGLLLADEGLHEPALASFATALEHLREVGDRRLEALTLGSLGELHLDRGRLDEAQACFAGALVIQRAIGDVRTEGATLMGLSRLHAARGELDEARRRVAASEAMLRAVGDPSLLARCLAVRAEIDGLEGDRDAARRALDEAERIGPPARSDVARAIERARALVGRPSGGP